MLRPRVFPALLLERGRLIKTIRFKNARYVGDPINAVRIYNDKEVDELLVLDIRAGVDGAPIPYALIEEIAGECFMPVSYGGGIRTLDEIARLFACGIEKVSINTAALQDPSFVSRACKRFGSQSIVVSVDVRKSWLGRYEVYADHGRRAAGVDPVTYARNMEQRGAGEILLTAIDREGTMEGYDVGLVQGVVTSVSIPVIACGGAGSVDDVIRIVRDGRAAAAAIGSLAVYQGRSRGVLIGFPSREQLAPLLTLGESIEQDHQTES
jgi:cyclase